MNSFRHAELSFSFQGTRLQLNGTCNKTSFMAIACKTCLHGSLMIGALGRPGYQKDARLISMGAPAGCVWCSTAGKEIDTVDRATILYLVMMFSNARYH
ncbi:uncharacterized protein BDZ99DRAFT_100641 [Mytilinidion resinicola]|uniref:Uncharacterized protein n=1 Tax=Mytilinidion resinicola TaxID=574789 RepID=A0A6A6YAW1_9PEZI|nr:uncharacterized protein BDZ99DRAFT_100641 [Mytilinidion resinicola]KAF2805952.1 hypothetical protein BDZ99DRAFT_100641 [Mytilinidion resinicola]